MDSRLELVEDYIYLIGKEYLTFGLPKIDGFNDFGIIHNRILVNLILIIFLIKHILLVLINEQYFAKLLADPSYNWTFSIQFNTYLYFSDILGFLIQFVIYSNFKNKATLKIIANEFRTRKVKQDHLESFKNSENLLKLSAILISILYVSISVIFTVEFNYRLIFHLFWYIIDFMSVIYSIRIFYGKIILFSLYCFRSKLLLRVENNLLFIIDDKRKPIKSYLCIKHLNRLNEIYCRIHDWNKIWSKYIAVNLICFSFLFGLLTLQLFFGNSNKMVEIFICFLIICILSISIPIYFLASIVNTESKITYKLLSYIFANYLMYKTESILLFRSKYKVKLISNLDNISFELFIFKILRD